MLKIQFKQILPPVRRLILWTKEWSVLGLGLFHSWNKSQVTGATLSLVPTVPDLPCSLSTCSQSSGHAATSFLTLVFMPIFKFLTCSWNLLASVPLHALACRLRNMAQTHFTISAQFWLPTPCGRSCLVQPPGGKPLLPAQQDMGTKYTMGAMGGSSSF